MELGRSGRSMMMSAGAGAERSEVRGHRQQIGKSAALTVGALALARAALRRRALNDQQKLAALRHNRCPHARARGGRRYQRVGRRPSCASWSSRLAARRAGRRRHFFLAELLFADSVRGDDGARAVGAIDDDDATSASPVVGGAGAGAARAQPATGSSTTDRKICSTDSGGACPRSRSAAAAARNDQQNLAALP